ncbi:hypothetical protein NFI95_15845 [Acetobacteraceae bacterium KSS8]|uniref:Uncharacterized protein n=1 Tax=Endosaccharibacter trunci TaxID=2812733 RepID=A0ABT1WBV9_9PROT|nr:hypothetical protein [Acetobacteraceae bacterium KSS8]
MEDLGIAMQMAAPVSLWQAWEQARESFERAGGFGAARIALQSYEADLWRDRSRDRLADLAPREIGTFFEVGDTLAESLRQMLARGELAGEWFNEDHQPYGWQPFMAGEWEALSIWHAPRRYPRTGMMASVQDYRPRIGQPKNRGWFERVRVGLVSDGVFQRANEPVAETAQGRRRSPGGYAKQDTPLIEEMHRLIQTGVAQGPWQAAGLVVDRASGGGTTESRRKRLCAAYKRQYPGFDGHSG